MAEQEWYTLQELADLFNTTYQRIRFTTSTLRNAGEVVTRGNLDEPRMIEIHRDSLKKIQNVLLGLK